MLLAFRISKELDMKRRLQKILLLGAVMTLGCTTGVAAEELPSVTSESIRSLTLVEDGEEIFRISNEPQKYKMYFDYWEVLNPYQESNTVDTEAMYELFSSILGLNFGEAAEIAEGLETGLADSDTYITLEYVSGTDETGCADPDSTLKILFGNETEEEGRYAALEGSDAVYVLSEAAVESVFGLEPFDYLLKIPVLINIEYLESVEITVDENTYTMEKDGDKYRLEGKKVEKEEFTTMYQALMNVFLDSEIEVNQEREREEVLRVKYNMKEEAPNAEVVFYTWDDAASYTVEVNGTEQFLVAAEEVDALIALIQSAF